MSNGTTTPTTTSTTAPIPTNPVVGKQTGTESSLSNWAGPYVTDMLAKGQALSTMPYQAYQGPLTAGASALQQQAFQGLGNLVIPTDRMGSYTPQSFTEQGVAQQYMNPYLQAALQPQIDEARRQAQIQRTQDAARLTRAGAYGGSRQAIMEAEGNRGLGTLLADITGKGYMSAYDKAAQQFNTEEDRRRAAQQSANEYGLLALGKQAELGGIQRNIEQEGLSADRAQFEEERAFPYKQVQYQQSLLQGLPLATQSYSYAAPSTLSDMSGQGGGLYAIFSNIFGGGNKPATTSPGTTGNTGTTT